MAKSAILDLALRLWPQVRDQGTVSDPSDLDLLLATQGQPGAPGFVDGVRHTFACFAPDEEAELVLPTGERATDDAEARLIAHTLVTRTLLGAGLHIDRRVQSAMGHSFAVTWAVNGAYDASPLTMATALWLVALDPDRNSDRPLPIDWDADYYQDPERWDLDYRLVSHYDMRERALDWVMYASVSPDRHPGCSIWTIIEPLLRLSDGRAHLALAQLGEASDEIEEGTPAAAMLERARIESLLRAFLAQLSPGRIPPRD
jgi:hypothetical protein